MTIREALAEAGVTINHMNKPNGHPTKDAFARVIAAVRDAESKSLQERDEARRQAADALELVNRLQAENHALKNELQKHRLKETLSEDAYEKLNRVEKTALLESAG